VAGTIAAVNAARRNVHLAPREAHGAYSITPAQPETAALAERILEVLSGDGLGHVRPADRVAVELLAVALRRLQQVEASLDRAGLLTRRGQVRPVAGLLVQLLREARAYCEALGMTPLARAKLGLETGRALDVAALLASMPTGRPEPPRSEEAP
jgi:hypothetical protein